MLGFMAKGDVKDITKVIEAIAYFYRGCTLWDVLKRIEHFSGEQKRNWAKIYTDMYDCILEGYCNPDGSDYFRFEEPKFDEEDKPF